MILPKELGVYLNIVHFKFKQAFYEYFLNEGLQITPEQYIVLDTLWDKGAMSQQKLADIMQKDKNSVTKLVDILEKKNLLTRKSDKNDRRVKILEVTELAASLKEKTTVVALNAVNDLLKNIHEDDLKKVIEVLRKINANIDDIHYGTII